MLKYLNHLLQPDVDSTEAINREVVLNLSLHKENTLTGSPIHNKMRGENDALFKQYERVTEDWRFQHRLIWEIPSVAVAILTGILIITYTQYNNLEPYIRISLLAASAVLLLALTIALIKHRFGADLRTQFIYELEKKIGIEILPLETDKALKWLSDHNQVITGGPLFRFILRRNISAEIMLVYLVFSSFLLLSALAAYEISRAVL